MCEFCTKHGEGKKWYLNVKNYSDDLLSDLKRREFVKEHFYWVDQTYKKYGGLMRALPLKVPLIGPPIKAIVKRIFLNTKWSQVIPIEEVEKILSLTNTIVRAPCVCRKSVTGKEHRVCFLMTMNPGELGVAGVIDQSYFGGPDIAKFETINKNAALDLMKGLEKNGVIHTVWAFKAPFIGAICNCDFSTGCIPMKMYRESAQLFFRAEYFAIPDKDKCSGCKVCIKNCPFNAIRYDIAQKKANIDLKKCYGCGICRAVCKYNAIRLIDRKENVVTANLWY